MTDSSGEERRLSNGAFYGKQRWSGIDSEAGICRDRLILRDFVVEFPPFDSRQMRF